MGNELKVFESNQFGDVRVVVVDNEPWFVAKDVCDALKIRTDTIRVILDSEDVATLNDNTIDLFTKHRGRKPLIVSEAGLYSLILKSRKPEAKAFKRWVTHEILPKIRKVIGRLSEVECSGNADGIVWIKNGIPITTSIVMANVFGYTHDDILFAIRHKSNTSEYSAQFCARHIQEIKCLLEDGRETRAFELDEQAFYFIASFFKPQLDEYRIRYIQAFARMNAALMDAFKARLVEQVLPQDNRTRQFVYVVKNPVADLVKIGVAHDVQRRIQQLETGAGVELELVYHSLVCSNAFSIERDVHAHFEQYRTFGEWFRVSPDEVVEYLEQQTFVLKNSFDLVPIF